MGTIDCRVLLRRDIKINKRRVRDTASNVGDFEFPNIFRMLFKFIPKTVGYQRIHDLQAFLVKQRVQQQLKQDLVLFCEHPPTYTVGRRIKHYEQETYLKSLGADFLYTKRVFNVYS